MDARDDCTTTPAPTTGASTTAAPTTPAATTPWPLQRSLRYAALIAPASVVGVLAAGAGHDAALRWMQRAASMLGWAPPATGHRPGRGRLAAYFVLGTLLGLVAWLLLAMIMLMIARGALYGFFDPGPYDDSWGGPSRTGAWLTHFVISLPIAAVALVLSVGVARLHYLMTRPVYGHRAPRWVVPLVLGVGACGGLFFIAWLQQI